MEMIAEAGEIAVSPETAALLAAGVVGAPKDEALLLAGRPDVDPAPSPVLYDVGDVDLASCLPLGVRELILSGHAEPEHRAVAAAFVEFSGADALVEHEGPEALAEAMDVVVRAAQAAAARYGPTFFQTDINRDGGKIMMIAGAPTTTGVDDDRMLLAARDIVEAPTALSVRVGINSGHVFCGVFGPPFRRVYSVKGDAINLAARVMGKAAPGQVLATDVVISRARSPFALEPVPPFAVKGKSGLVNASAVGPVAERPQADRPTGVRLIGRDAELEVLEAALADARSRRGRVVELVGEPGHGKSALAAALLERASDVEVLSVACQPYEQQQAYFPFRLLLRDLISIEEGADESDARERLTARVASNAPELVPWVPLLGAVIDVPLVATPETSALADEFRRAKLHEVVLRFLEVTLPTPTLFLVEDAHWMDDASTDLLREVSRAAAGSPWLVLVTRREEDGRFRAPDEPHVRTIPIGPLDESAAAELALAATEDTPLAAHDIEALVRRAGGNPLFLRELVDAARTAGTTEDLPGSVEALVAAEIDRLAAGDRALLRQAAVLGNRFDLELFGALSQDGSMPPAETWSRLSAFVTVSDGAAAFSHALIRDAAYEGLPYRRRRELHERAATAIERTAADLEERSEVLSLHHFHAGSYGPALAHSRRAAERALEKFALVEAAAFYLRAVEAGRRCGAGPTELAALSESLGDVQERIGRYGEANTAYRAARRATASDPIAQARLLLKQAWIPERAGRYADALRWVRRGQRALEGVEGVEAMRQRAQLSAWYAAVRGWQGRYAEAERWCRQAIEEAEAAGELDALAHAYFILDWISAQLGRFSDTANSERALEIYRRLGNLGRQATIWNNLGAFAYWAGRWDEARSLYEQARDARMRLGDVVDAAMGTNNIGEILLDQGHLEEAEGDFREALRVWRAAGFSQGVAYALANLGRVAARSGRFDEALERFEEARALFASIGAEPELIDLDVRVAEAHLLAERFVEAIDHVEHALVRARTPGGVGASEPALRRIEGLALLATGDVEAAVDRLHLSVDLARRRGSEHDRALALLALADAYASAGSDPVPARDEALAILGALGVGAIDAGRAEGGAGAHGAPAEPGAATATASP
jgi:class 3 adenylate cyclase/tetratricopeptide (TPR) repeat protein